MFFALSSEVITVENQEYSIGSANQNGPEVKEELLEKDPDWIRKMFADIASRYDLANTVLTGALDEYWRSTAASVLNHFSRAEEWFYRPEPLQFIDACTGSGKLAQTISQEFDRSVQLQSVDFCLPLLKQGVQSDRFGLGNHPVGGDVLRLPVYSESVNAVSMAFGYRNVTNRNQVLREIHRILEQRGFFLILEFHQPVIPLISDVFNWYFQTIFPRIGRLISGSNFDAYNYLQESVVDFPSFQKLRQEFTTHDFALRYHRQFLFGITHLYLLQKR